MKYSLEIEIDLPRDRVIELFDNPDNIKKWQPGLVSFEHVSGEPGQVGAKSKLVYKMGKRTINMVETITTRDLPDVFSGVYDADGVHNTMVNRFEQPTPNKTKWIAESEFRFSGVMKMMSLVMPKKMFERQTCEFMQSFKTFAEGEGPRRSHA